ncbi:PucR family transcriptional regulator [Nocardia thailandica]
MTIDDRPAAVNAPIPVAPGDIPTLARRVTDRLAGTTACAALPGDLATVVETCLALALAPPGAGREAVLRRLRATAAGWAREGIPLDTVTHVMFEAVEVGVDLALADAGRSTPHGIHQAATGMLALLDIVTGTVSQAYVEELRAVIGAHHDAVHTLTSALLGGRGAAAMARECGVRIAESYTVLAVAIGRHREPGGPPAAEQHRDPLRRVQAELTARGRGAALALLSTTGGTVLLPAGALTDDEITRLVDGLTRAARTPVTAALIQADTADIPRAADEAHDLLDMVLRLGGGPGLFRFAELALEYQLTRPGPGREHLVSLLDPLDHHPELRETLSKHIATELNRRRTAAQLHVHANTVDYRLERIAQLTGLDPRQPSDLWQLRSALVARTYRHRGV